MRRTVVSYIAGLFLGVIQSGSLISSWAGHRVQRGRVQLSPSLSPTTSVSVASGLRPWPDGHRKMPISLQTLTTLAVYSAGKVTGLHLADESS